MKNELRSPSFAVKTSFAMLDYTRNFEIAAKEGLKRATNWAAYYQ